MECDVIKFNCFVIVVKGNILGWNVKYFLIFKYFKFVRGKKYFGEILYNEVIVKLGCFRNVYLIFLMVGFWFEFFFLVLFCC